MLTSCELGYSDLTLQHQNDTVFPEGKEDNEPVQHRFDITLFDVMQYIAAFKGCTILLFINTVEVGWWCIYNKKYNVDESMRQ